MEYYGLEVRNIETAFQSTRKMCNYLGKMLSRIHLLIHSLILYIFIEHYFASDFRQGTQEINRSHLFSTFRSMSQLVGLVTKLCPTLASPWTVAQQSPLSMGLFRQEHWYGLPFPSPGDLTDPGIDPGSPELQADSLLTELQGKPSYRS